MTADSWGLLIDMDLLKFDKKYQDLNCWLNMHDVASLEGWLTDNVIQFFGEIIEKNFALKSLDIHISILHPVATLFIRSDPQSVLEHSHLVEKDWIFCPIFNSPKYENQGNHWSLLVISRNLSLSLYMDSLLPSKANMKRPTFEVEIAQETSDIICGFCKWTTDFRIIPCLQQSNAHDCGVYVILYMCWICHFLIEGDLQWIDSGLIARQMRHDVVKLRSYLRDEINLYLRSRTMEGTMVIEHLEYHPSLLWSQDENRIFISVKLTEVEDPRMQIGNAAVHFHATGMGANGLQEYVFSLDLFKPIDDETSDFTVTETGVNIVLVKREAGVWPRLTQAANQRPPWLRTDFDRLSSAVVKAMLVAGGDADESDSSEEDSQFRTNVNFIRPSAEEIRKRNMERAEQIAREQCDALFNYMKNPLVIYLLLYNIFQWAGFIYIFGVIIRGWWTEGDAVKTRVFDMVADRLIVLQLASLLEVAHVLLKWVKGAVLPTIIQVFGRNLVFFAILLPHKELQEDTAVFNLFLAWSTIELVRYPYYALRLFDEEIGLITYLRYTLWIPLYPIGFMSEGKLIILAMPLLEASRRFCIEMPNPANISFDFSAFLHIYILLMLPGFLIQMQTMYLQRRKKLTSKLNVRAGGDRAASQASNKLSRH